MPKQAVKATTGLNRKAFEELMDIINARVVGHPGLQQICTEGDTITAISPMSTSTLAKAEGLDVAADWISLGGVDLQINGALGLAFPDVQPGDEAKLMEICRFLWQQGVDGFLPTIVTTAVEKIHQTLEVLANFSDRSPTYPTAKILGVHLEGPFLNPEKRGAHPAEYLLPLTLEQVQRVVGDYGNLIKLVTLAPELDDTGETIAYLKSHNITVSLGHSQATAAQAQRAFEQGATMVTHAFNAMPSLHHREPGLLGAAIVHPGVLCGLIADGQHISPTMVEVLLKASGYGQGIFLVSDALSPLGLPDGLYPWDTRQIQVSQGTARLPEGTLAGTTVSLLSGVQNLVKWGCPIEQAIDTATLAPRRAIGLCHTQNPYIGESASHLLRWHYLDAGSNPELTWQRLLESDREY